MCCMLKSAPRENWLNALHMRLSPAQKPLLVLLARSTQHAEREKYINAAATIIRALRVLKRRI
jgi:hypothetical protein